MERPRLLPLALRPLPLGAIRPTGWLLNQLRIQAEGLSGHLDEFWPDIARSGWIGGEVEGWERGPYWLDGVMPLAYLLGDAALQAKVSHWMDHILEHQGQDGWLGPCPPRKREALLGDVWPFFILLKAVAEYHEATDDQHVLRAAERLLRFLDSFLDEKPLSGWAKYRWQDLVLGIHWLYELTGGEWLLALAAKVRGQGYDWQAHFADFRYPERVARGETNMGTQVVNNAMAIKQPGVWYRQSRDEADSRAARRFIETLDRCHGQATGVFTGDEHYAGLNPSQGTELCAVVEYMFSLEVLVAALGDPLLADRLEKIAFNALPATFKPDMWAHQYDQQANQVICRVSEDRVYASNGPDANIFGLEPNYGCCTANMHQGWPKFASHLWMRTEGEGFAAVAYAPCEVRAEAGGRPVRISVSTGYPFADTISITVKVEGVAHFPLWLRIPAWCEEAEVAVGREAPVPAAPAAFHVVPRAWGGTTEVILRVPMTPRVQRRFHNSVAIERGPLVYALKIGEDWRMIGGELPHVYVK